MADEKKAETQHSPEPWRALLNGSGPHSIATKASVVVVSFCAGIENPDDARRIVACVNACAGIPTAALEAGALEEALDALADEPTEGHETPKWWRRYQALRTLGRDPNAGANRSDTADAPGTGERVFMKPNPSEES